MTFATLGASLLLCLRLVRRDLMRVAADEPLPAAKGTRIGPVLLFATVVVLLAPRLWDLVI